MAKLTYKVLMKEPVYSLLCFLSDLKYGTDPFTRPYNPHLDIMDEARGKYRLLRRASKKLRSSGLVKTKEYFDRLIVHLEKRIGKLKRSCAELEKRRERAENAKLLRYVPFLRKAYLSRLERKLDKREWKFDDLYCKLERLEELALSLDGEEDVVRGVLKREAEEAIKDFRYAVKSALS